MNVIEPLGVAFTQLRANKMRSFLTILGILIGVGSVMGVTSIGEGMRRQIVSEFEQVGGSKLIVVSPPRQWVRRDGRWVRRSWEEHLVVDDIQKISEECPLVETVIPMNASGAQLKYRKANTQGDFWGVNPDFSDAWGWPVEQGRFISLSDLKGWRKIAVIGHKIKEDLFGDKSAVGKEIKINGRRYEVVGVMAEKRMFYEDWGQRVFIPFTTAAKRMIGNDYLDVLFVYAKTARDATAAAEEIRRTLLRYKLHGDEFEIETADAQIQDVNRIFGIMKLVVGGIAFVSLLVGGIGIMNIMLVSVTERTREIGIRKAVGARRRTILTQFLIESAFMCLFGGILGVLFGLGLGFGISTLITTLTGEPFPSVISVQATVTALIFSASWGILFGVFPAWKAAKLHPVDALRYE
ncbi:MAG: ABC transporter permease [Candidatus Aminicenantaceae bacterium]